MKTPVPAIRILFAGSQTIFRAGLCRLLEREPDLEIVGQAAEASEAAMLAAEVQPDVVLLDLSIPAAAAGDLLRTLGVSCPKTRTIILGSAMDMPFIAEALRLGARGAVMKSSSATVLVSSIRGVMNGLCWAVDHPCNDRAALLEALAESVGYDLPPKDFGLTPRELEIVSAIVSGYSNRHIAEKLSISEATVKHHMTNLFDKLGVYSRLELALFAIHHGLVG